MIISKEVEDQEKQRRFTNDNLFFRSDSLVHIDFGFFLIL